ncbi:MBL fold metallo-hydrolase [Desulfovibrio sp. OttesenSCG-928-C06]|nr:MBL fold metallo-hydrolase [Desulfovibrio sp. OttesenSCG-928-C06]
MASELIMFGTGCALVTRCYNTCFAIKSGDEYFLVDGGGGNGVLSQMGKASVDLLKVRAMFVTHAHTDHLLGVIWVLRFVAMRMIYGEYPGQFHVYCHDELERAIRTICNLVLPPNHLRFFDNGIVFHVVADGDKAEAAGLELSFFDLGAVKSKQFGFKATLPDGQALCCLGDEPCRESSRQHVKNADWLMAEAFCLYAQRETFKPYDKGHSTALDAARLAQELGVKNLVLYHTEDTQLDKRKALYSDEAASAFDGRIFVPDDLERIILEAGEV